MDAAKKKLMTPEEFFEWEDGQLEKHNYYRGEVWEVHGAQTFAMSGGSERHNRLSMLIARLVDQQLDGTPCMTLTSDQRIALGEDQYCYADAVVVCGPPETRSGKVLTNPAIVVEVLSRSTSEHDRGAKQASYLGLPSLRHLVFVSQTEPRIEVITPVEPGRFDLRILGAGESFAIHPEHPIVLDVDRIYAGAFDLPGDEPK